MAPEQVQDFHPTPPAISTCMYYTGLERAACCRDSRSEERENRKPPLFVFVRVNGKIGSAFTEDLVVDSVVLGEEGDVVVAQAIVSAIFVIQLYDLANAQRSYGEPPFMLSRVIVGTS